VLIGSDERIRLADFATCHLLGTNCQQPFVGSPQYIAPEVIQGFKRKKRDVSSWSEQNLQERSRQKRFGYLRSSFRP
jgi:serine/threonine protein kinase